MGDCLRHIAVIARETVSESAYYILVTFIILLGIRNKGRCEEIPIMQNEMIYASKKDWWLMVIIAAAGLALAGAAAYQVSTNGLAHPASWILLLCLLFYLTVVLIFAYPVSYEIRPPDLLIRAGLTRSRITLSSIEAVSPTRDPASAPALSLDRLRIDYLKKGKPTFSLVSPEDKAAFLTNLVQSTDGLELRGNQMIRSTMNTDAQQVAQPDT
jgi:hypothetical protein